MSEPVNPNNSPNNSLGNHPPVPQHQPGNTDTNPEFYGQQSPPPTVKKNRTGIIAGATIAGLLLLGGGAYAVTSVINVAGDKDIARAVPSDSAVFVQLDMNPSVSQKAAALSIASKIDALVDNEDEYNTEGKDFKEIATDPAFEELDYETEVKPWIGDKVAIASWGDFSNAYNDDYGNDDSVTGPDIAKIGPEVDSGYSSDPYDEYYDDAYLDGEYDNLDSKNNDELNDLGNKSGVDIITPNIDTVTHDVGDVSEGASKSPKKDPSLVLVYEVKNKAKAEAAAQKIIERTDRGNDSENGSENVGAYTLHGNYLVLAENAEIISEYVDSLEKSNLAANDTYVSDMNLLGGDNIATAWLDISQMGVDGYLQDIGFDEEGETLRGRVATGISLTDKGVTSNTKVIGVEGYESIINADKSADTVTEIGSFSKDSMVAVSMTGLPEFAETILDEYKKMDSESVQSFLDEAKRDGFIFPQDFKKIFGSETGIGFVADASYENSTFEYRAKGADLDKLKSLAEKEKSLGIDVTSEGDTQVARYSTGNAPSEEKLSTHEKFNDAFTNLDKSEVAVFLNVDALRKLDASAKSDDNKDYGVVGMTSSHDEEKNISDVTVKWIF